MRWMAAVIFGALFSPALSAGEAPGLDLAKRSIAVSDASGEHQCGLERRLLLGSSSDEPMTAVEAQLISALTEDAQGVGGLMRMRIVRMVMQDGEPRVLHLVPIGEASVTAADGVSITQLGSDAQSDDEGFWTSGIDPGVVSKFVWPIGNDVVLTYREADASEAQTIRFAAEIPDVERQRYRECSDRLTERGRSGIGGKLVRDSN
ncbi:MAG: hypothetical protein O9256_00755 [Rhizobiaceae bacterium]|nr:hypothetical protein [Rhizobiaceae bacterium]